jgi:hypothetical protein
MKPGDSIYIDYVRLYETVSAVPVAGWTAG